MTTESELSQDSPLTRTAELELDPLHELREVTSSPTPLSEVLQDPAVLRALIGNKKPSRRGSISSARNSDRDYREKVKDSRRSKKESDTASILTLVLAEEERQAHQLKSVLRTTGDRLQTEMRRAEQAEERARSAENRAREATARAQAAEAARHQAELEVARAREEIIRYRMLAEAAERDSRRLESDLQRVERMRNEADQAVADSRDVARKAQQTVREWQAREEGRAEGMRSQLLRRYEDGREDGFEDGRAEGYEHGRNEGFEEGRSEGVEAGRQEGHASGRLEGFEEGKRAGYNEGFNEGYEEGRKDERVNAIKAFDKFIESEADGQSIISPAEDDRTHQWVESTKHIMPPSSPKPIRAPSPVIVREPSPQPKPVWLYRQPRATSPGPMRAISPQVIVQDCA